MRIALLMGSFNPIHKGHTGIAGYVLSAGLADQVWFVVSPHNPLKEAADLAPAEDRMEMVRIALRNNPSFAACNIELSMQLPSYTIYTIKKLQELYPDYNFTILAGSDTVGTLHLWHKIDELKQLISFTIYPRAEYDSAVTPGMENAPIYNISSTLIRRNLATGIFRLEELDAEVLKYVIIHNLYNINALQLCDNLISTEPDNAENYLLRGELHYKNGRFPDALNDFDRALRLNPDSTQARELKIMVEEIVEFHYADIYNP